MLSTEAFLVFVLDPEILQNLFVIDILLFLLFFERHGDVKTNKPVVSCTLSVGNGWVLHGMKVSMPSCVCVCVVAAIVSSGIMSSVSFFFFL